MEAKMLEQLVAATSQVFETMLFMEVIPGAPLAVRPEPFSSDLSAQIAIAGGLSGCITVHMPLALALEATGNILSSQFEEVTPEVCDAVGEVANMIVGNFKTRLGREAALFHLSIPVIVHGPMSWFVHRDAKGDFPRVVIPFQCGEHTFHIDFMGRAQ